MFPHGKTNSYGILTASFGKETFTVQKQETDKEGCILVVHVSINVFEYILINLCDTNTEIEQINVLSNKCVLLEDFDTNPPQKN